MMRQDNSQKDRGFALLSAIVALAILLLLTSSMVMISGAESVQARMDVERSQAEALADAIMMQAVLALQDARQDARPRVDGVPSVLNVMGIPVTVKIEDEYGKVDLNAAPPLILSRLFQFAGMSTVDSDQLADFVEAWRNADHTGSQAVAAPGNRTGRRVFRTAEELLLVPGVTPDTFAKIEPGLTVLSGRDQIDRAVAPYEALLTTGMFGPEEASRIVHDRFSGEEADEPLSAIHNGKVAAGIDQRGWPFRIRCWFGFGHSQYSLDVSLRLLGTVWPGYVIAQYKFSS